MSIFSLLSAPADQPAPSQGGGANWTTYAILGVIIVLFIVWWFFNKKKRKKSAQQEQELKDSLRIGDKVKTIGGICGFVVEINDKENTFILETGSGQFKSYAKFDKQAIYQMAHTDGKGNVIEDKPAEEQKVEEKTEEIVDKKSKKDKNEKVEVVNQEVKEEVTEQPTENQEVKEEPKAE